MCDDTPFPEPLAQAALVTLDQYTPGGDMVYTDMGVSYPLDQPVIIGTRPEGKTGTLVSDCGGGLIVALLLGCGPRYMAEARLMADNTALDFDGKVLSKVIPDGADTYQEMIWVSVVSRTALEYAARVPLDL